MPFQGLIPRFAEQQAQRQGNLTDTMMAQKFGQELATKEMQRREKLQENSKKLKQLTDWLPYAPPEEQGKILGEVGQIVGVDFSGAKPDEVLNEFKKLDKMSKTGGPQLVQKGLESLKQRYGLNPLYKDRILQKERELAASQGQEGMQTQQFMETGTAPKVGAGNDKEFAPDMQTWVNQATGEDISINARDETQRALADKAGFSPVSPTERGYGVETGKISAQRESEMIKSAAKARSQVVTLDSMDKLLDRFESGKLANWKMKAQQWGKALGFNVDVSDMSSKEAFNAVAQQLALRSRNMGEGMVLAGQMSDRDVQFLRDMNPQLIISKAGNRLIIKMRKAIAKRETEIAKMVRQYKKEYGGKFNATDFDGYVAKKFSDTSIFGIPENAKIAGTDKKTGLPVYESNGKYYIPEF